MSADEELLEAELNEELLAAGVDPFEVFDLGLTTEQLEAIARGEVPDELVAPAAEKLEAALDPVIKATTPDIDGYNPANINTLDGENLSMCLTTVDGYRKWLVRQFIINAAERRMLQGESTRRKKEKKA